MGVDACMFFITTEPIEPDALLALACDLHIAFPRKVDVFRGFREMGESFTLDEILAVQADSNKWDRPHHCITAIDVYTQDGPDIEPTPGQHFYEVGLQTRYWGPGYTRGDLPTILMIRRWLLSKVPGCTVLYGGDSSGIEADVFNDELEESLWDLFVAEGDTYHGHWDGYDDLNKQPICQLCKRPYNRFGCGDGYAAYHCPGCGDSIQTTDGGKTWTEHKNKWGA